jgi:putative membrane protein
MGDGFGHGFGGLWMILIWVLPLVLIIWAFGAFRGRQGGGPRDGPRDRTALDLLDEEYAKGRIDREEYLRRKEDLKR